MLDVPEVARRSGLAEVTVRDYIRRGRIPAPDQWGKAGPRWRATPITQWIRDRGPRRATTSQCGTPSGWRRGCGCDPCYDAHNLDTRDWRRGKARIPDDIRASVLADLAAGGHITEVATDHELTCARLHGQARTDPDWAAAMDAALTEGRDPTLAHGLATTYRHDRCRCPDCRDAHHRGDGIAPDEPSLRRQRSPHRTIEATCVLCTRTFTARTNLTRYCGPTCRDLAAQARELARTAR